MTSVRLWAAGYATSLALSVAVLLSGCASTPEEQAKLDDAISIATGALNVATAANQLANANAARTAPPVASPALAPRPLNTTAGVTGGAAGGAGGKAAGNAASNNLPAQVGYSQRGAFEECQMLYQAAGMAHLAAECAARAQNMQSLGPAAPRR